MKRDSWWEEYFDEHFLLVEGIKPKEVNERSADFIEEVFKLPKGSLILDLGCGYGRIAIELAKRGYRVVGLDRSPKLLQMAKELAQQEGVEVEFVKADMREMGYQGEFDGVLSWDTSFGYFSDEENERVLKLIARALKQGGKLLLDLHHREAYIRKHLGKSWQRRGDYWILEDWTFDVYESRLNIKGFLIDPKAGRGVEYLNSFREYTLPELKRILEDAGLKIQRIYGDLNPTLKELDLNCDSVQTLAIKASTVEAAEASSPPRCWP